MGVRIPTTNGDTPPNVSKSITAESSHHSPSTHSKAYQVPSPPPPQKLEFRAMRELLADDRRDTPFQMDQGTGHGSVDESDRKSVGQQSSGEKNAEKSERESPFSGGQQQDQQAVQIPSSPVHLENDSNSGDGNFDEHQSELVINFVEKFFLFFNFFL
jgi:hypothetical protein